MAKDKREGPAKRPTPKQLLELAAKEQLGRLKVFLGMAPGVGKTYAMLSAARAVKADGGDVAVGVVETHGRSDTAALLDGLEVLPRMPLEYRQRTLMEFDLVAALARKPKLLLIDELAHTNAPGSIHTKRYQDVEEVLRHGIDVWTTVNIQHLESLQDVVEKITGVRVPETIPDKILDRADEIVLVDLPPEDLIQRLKEGKVYLPDNARRAIDKFFKPSNLTALRELALRRTADRVDVQMIAQLRQQGIEGPWPTAERILVCVGSDRESEAVIRTAARLATAQKADWVALHVNRDDREINDRRAARQIEKMLRLAQRLGASTARLNGRDLSEQILGYARRNNITQILVGRSQPRFLNGIFRRRLSPDLIERACGLSVLVVAPEQVERPESRLEWPEWSSLTTSVLSATLAVIAAIAVGSLLERLTPLPNLSMVFLLAVLLCALQFGLASALAASALSFLAYNFFFIDPRFTFTVAEPYELLSLFIFLVVAFVTGSLAGRLKQQAEATRERARATQTLFDFSRKLSAAPKLDDVLWLLTNQAAASAKGQAVVLLDQAQGLHVAQMWPPGEQLSTSDWAAARWTLERQEPAGRGTSTLPAARFHFRAIVGTSAALGVIGVDPGANEDALAEPTVAMLQSFVEQSAVAIERIELVARTVQTEAAAEGERLRGALLSSISHDFRTPLASIVGAVSSLRTLGEKIPQADRADLLLTIEEEAGRLSRFVSNLLDMTRLEGGAIDIRRDWVDVKDAVSNTIGRARRLFPQRKVIFRVRDGLPLIKGDAALLEQVLFNLLDNAHKYSGIGSVIEVDAKAGAGALEIAVSDQGIGIPPEALDKVFDKFYRVAGSDGRAPGIGLGLAICAAIVKGFGGSIRAESPIRDGVGTRITIALPVADAPERPVIERPTS